MIKFLANLSWSFFLVWILAFIGALLIKPENVKIGYWLFFAVLSLTSAIVEKWDAKTSE